MGRTTSVVLAASSVYETEPVGEVSEQRDFYNACVRIETSLDPEGLLDACKAVERALGRELAARATSAHGPRPIDVDVLLLEDIWSCAPTGWCSPTRRCRSRRFVLVPLLELDPDLEIPGGGGRAADALAALGPGQEVRRTGPPLDSGADASR